jgi:hypothetical protein
VEAVEMLEKRVPPGSKCLASAAVQASHVPPHSVLRHFDEDVGLPLGFHGVQLDVENLLGSLGDFVLDHHPSAGILEVDLPG